MTKKLSWRLSKLPTPDEVRELVKDQIITQEEAREILFSDSGDERTAESLKAEIKFLRDLVDRLSKDRTVVVEKIREVIPSYKRWPWYEPYWTYTSAVAQDSNIYLSTSTNSELSAVVTF